MNQINSRKTFSRQLGKSKYGLLDYINENFLILLGDNIVAIFFNIFICYTQWSIYRWNNMMTEIYSNIVQKKKRWRR